MSGITSTMILFTQYSVLITHHSVLSTQYSSLITFFLFELLLNTCRHTGDHRVGRHVFCHHRTSSGYRPSSHSNWSDQHCVGTDFHVVFDNGLMFVLAVVITGD